MDAAAWEKEENNKEEEDKEEEVEEVVNCEYGYFLEFLMDTMFVLFIKTDTRKEKHGRYISFVVRPTTKYFVIF